MDADDKGALRIGTVDSYLIYCLTGGKVHATDHTNASRTLLYNIKSNTWDKELMDLFLVKPRMLPKLLSSNDHYGNTEEDIVGINIPIVGVTGDKRINSDKGIMTFVAWSMAYQVADLVELMETELGEKLEVLNVDGGPTANSILMQLQAYLLKTTLQTGANSELSCLGAVYLGGLKLGFWSSLKELKALKEKSMVYEPNDHNVDTKKLMSEWHKAINSVLV